MPNPQSPPPGDANANAAAPTRPASAVMPVTSGPVPGGTPTVLTPANSSTSTSAPVSSVAVTVPAQSGTVMFSLVVTDNLGVESAPASAAVTIQGPPVAVLTATPAAVAPGGAIELSGSGSTSTGTIVRYTFSLMPTPNAANG